MFCLRFTLRQVKKDKISLSRVVSSIYRLGEKSRVAGNDAIARGSEVWPPPGNFLNEYPQSGALKDKILENVRVVFHSNLSQSQNQNHILTKCVYQRLLSVVFYLQIYRC